MTMFFILYNINMKIDTFKVNHRYLVKIWPSYRDISEVEVLEIAKKHIKLKIFRSDGSTYMEWEEVLGIKIVEDLGIATSMIDDNLSKSN